MTENHVRDVENPAQLVALLKSGRFRIQETTHASTGPKKNARISRALICAPKSRPYFEWEIWNVPTGVWRKAGKDGLFTDAFPSERLATLTDKVNE